MDDWPQLTIGEVARKAGLASSTIRYYESIGLLSPPARMHGQRRYDRDVLGKLAFIAVARSAGFTLEEIRQFAHGADDDADLGARMRVLSSRKLGEVEAILERANAMKSWLEVAKTCGCQTPDECTLFPEGGGSSPPLADLSIIQVQGGHCRREPTPRA